MNAPRTCEKSIPLPSSVDEAPAVGAVEAAVDRVGAGAERHRLPGRLPGIGAGTVSPPVTGSNAIRSRTRPSM